MKTLKERIKRWVVSQHGGAATTSNVKKHYKWFRASNQEHWQLLAMMMMPDLFPSVVEPTEQPKKRDMGKERYQQLVLMTDYLHVTYGVVATSWDFAGRCTCNLQHQGMGCGYIGWLESRQTWIYATRTHTIPCDSLQTAVDRFLAMNPDIF